VMQEHNVDPTTGAVRDTFTLIKSRDASPAVLQAAGQLGAGALDLARIAMMGAKPPATTTADAQRQQQVVDAAKAQLAKQGHQPSCVPALETPAGSVS
jgi:hypothetical protein